MKLHSTTTLSAAIRFSSRAARLRGSMPGASLAVATALALAGLVAAPHVQADVDRDKKQAELEEQVPDEKKGKIGDGGSVEDLARQGEANLKSISEMMDSIRDDLSQKQTGETTQKKQQQVVKKLDELIDALVKASQQQGSSSSSSSQQQQQQQSGGSQKQQKQGKQQAQNRQQGEMKPGEQQGKEEKQKQGEKPQGQQEKYGPTKNDQVSEGKNPRARPKNLEDVFGASERWGLLPRRLQEAASTSSDRQFPQEYRDLIARYYERMANALTPTSSSGRTSTDSDDGED